MGFVGRAAEMAVLDRAAGQPGSAFVPVYGRRRVGKSELILRWLADRRGVYLVGKRAPAAAQLREFLALAAVILDEPLVASAAVDGWGAALDLVVGRWSRPEKLVLALDEFQWLVEASPELPSVLQERWDRSWSRSGRVVLILCGSYVGFMEREVLGERSPLFGRRTAQIHLQPFLPREARGFHPEWSLADCARARFVCGGVPAYLRLFDPSASIAQNLVANVLDEFGPLRREPDFLLREELRDVQGYYAVLTALAAGRTDARTIAADAGIPERSLGYYLHQLEALGYARRRWPLDGGPAAQRKVRWTLADPLLCFWFRFVWPNLSVLARLGPDRAFQQIVAPELEAWFGLGFERLSREALADLYDDERVTAAAEIGEYWAKDVQIDVVGIRADARIDLGECKWGALDSPGTVARELRAKATKFPNPRGDTVGLRVFSRVAPGHVPEGVRWHDLPGMYGER